jgi:hypothetical protein
MSDQTHLLHAALAALLAVDRVAQELCDPLETMFAYVDAVDAIGALIEFGPEPPIAGIELTYRRLVDTETHLRWELDGPFR